MKAEKIDNSNKVNQTQESSSKEIQILNSTVKNLRTVLEKFKTEKLKSTEARKSNEIKIATERTIREKEINVLKKESTTLKLQLDKANLERVKAIEGVNHSNAEAQADRIALANEFKEFRQESARKIKALNDKATTLHNQLAQFKDDSIKSNQPKISLSSAKKIRELASPIGNQQKNKTAGILRKPEIKKVVTKKKSLTSAPLINPETIIKTKVLHWVKAWESRNIPLYLSFYSQSFEDPKRSRRQWEIYRRKSLENALNISIQLSNIKISLLNNTTIRVRFIQRFKSNNFSDVGLKELVWKKSTENWKIIKETWKPR